MKRDFFGRIVEIVTPSLSQMTTSQAAQHRTRESSFTTLVSYRYVLLHCKVTQIFISKAWKTSLHRGV